MTIYIICGFQSCQISIVYLSHKHFVETKRDDVSIRFRIQVCFRQYKTVLVEFCHDVSDTLPKGGVYPLDPLFLSSPYLRWLIIFPVKIYPNLKCFIYFL